MVAKGHVKVKRAERRKLRYIVTPSGLALRARLTLSYVESSMLLYRQLRQAARIDVNRAHQSGYEALHVEGDGDVADVCRLTCLEMGVQVVDGSSVDPPAILRVEGDRICFIEPRGDGGGSG
jgi:hypothetical protein